MNAKETSLQEKYEIGRFNVNFNAYHKNEIWPICNQNTQKDG
jgi:hypothetical protein